VKYAPLYPLPVDAIDIIPEWRGFNYIMVGDEILVSIRPPATSSPSLGRDVDNGVRRTGHVTWSRAPREVA